MAVFLYGVLMYHRYVGMYARMYELLMEYQTYDLEG